MPAALVTGAASGIGKATAERLRADGFDVLGFDLEDGDLSTREGNRAAVDAALERFGRLDLVVANAGIQHVAPVAEFPEDKWDAILAILLTSPFLLAKYAWDALQEPGGRFIAVASAHALVASPEQGRVRRGQARRARPGEDLGARGTAGHRRLPGLRAHAAGGGADPRPGEAHGMSEDDVLEEVILAPHAVKRLIEPDEVANVIAFLAGPGGAAFSGVPVTMDLGWSAR